MKIQLPNWSRKTFISVIVLLLAIAAVAWVNPSMSKKDVEELMYKRFNARLTKKIDRIDCYAEAVGKEFRSQLACNYMTHGKFMWDVKHIDFENDVHASIWAISGIHIGEISYERESLTKVQLSVASSNDNNAEKLSRANILWLDAVVDSISAGQP